MLCREIICVERDNHKEYLNAVRDKIQCFVMRHQGELVVNCEL